MLFFVIYKFLIIQEGADETPAEKTARYKNLIQTYREKVTKLDYECNALGGFKEPKPPTQQVAQMQSYYNKGFIPKDLSKLDDKALTSMIDNLKLAEPLLQDYKKTLSSAVDVCKAQAKTEFEAKQKSDIYENPLKQIADLIGKIESKLIYMKNKLDHYKDAKYPLSKLIKFIQKSYDIYSKNIKVIKDKDEKGQFQLLPTLIYMDNNLNDLHERIIQYESDNDVQTESLGQIELVKDPENIKL